MSRKFQGLTPLQILEECRGYYSCPRGPAGGRLGPLVGYTGEYNLPDGTKKHWVGEVYANFAKAEEHPDVLIHYANCMTKKHPDLVKNTDILCGAPIGGYAFSLILGLVTGRQVIKAEKKVIALATKESREKTELIFGRHDIVKRMQYTIVEDVCNNFSTTEKLIQLIESIKGGVVTNIICLLNRSMEVTNFFYSASSKRSIPIFSLVQLPIKEYHQDDPYVADDIERGNIVWKPKDQWDRLLL